MQIILLGAPGSGKGVQAGLVVNRYHITHISTGNILRQEIDNKSELGLEASRFVEKGMLVPDEVIIRIIESKLIQTGWQKGFVLDGIPRTIPQAESLEQLLKKQNYNLDKVIYLNVDEEKLVIRLTNRMTCLNCGRIYNLLNHPPKIKDKCDICDGKLIQRVDDQEDTVRKRFMVYNNQTKPLLQYYRNKEVLLEIDGNRDIDVIFGDICAELDKIRVS